MNVCHCGNKQTDPLTDDGFCQDCDEAYNGRPEVRKSLDAAHNLGVPLAPQYWYTCDLCGQRIVDGKPCGCGAR